MKEIYLDNGATTKPLEEVVEQMKTLMLEEYGNPSSYHKMGLQAEQNIKDSSDYFARVLQACPSEIIYTSGGTESNNMAIIGTALAYQRRGKRIITTQIEHPSVQEAFRHLESQGFEVTYVSVDKEGYIDLDQLIRAIDDQTTLVSVMHVNNEIATVQDIEKIGNKIKETNPQTLFHVDAVQSFGKIPIHRKRSAIDLLSISSHKIHGPKGVGLLYKNKNVRIHPLILGGGQQGGLRSGTENVAGIVGMHVAAKHAISNREAHAEKMSMIKEKLTKEIISRIDNSYVNGPDVSQGAPHIVNIGFQDIRSEILLHALEGENIYVSSGSACSTNKSKEVSATLVAIGKKGTELDQAIRFSFGVFNSIDEVDKVLLALEKNIPMLRKVLQLGGKRR